MKKILLFFVLGVLLASCSGKLTTSKAEKLIEEKLKQNPVERYVTLKTGEISLFGYNEMRKADIYEKLQKEGLITFIKKEGLYEYRCSINLTEKGKKYVVDTKKIDRMPYTENKIKSYSITLDKVEEIHLIPMMNAAEVLTSFKVEKTPFVALEDQATLSAIGEGDYVSKKIEFIKLENKGWKSGNIDLTSR
ncbi:MAG: hypothetical protein ACFN40_08110 [Bacteroidota bacterium]